MAPLTDVSALDAHMASNSYVDGFTPSQKDISVFKAISEPSPTHKHALRWFKHIGSFSAAKVASLPGKFETLAAAASAPEPAPAQAPAPLKEQKEKPAAKEQKTKAPKEEKPKEEKSKEEESKGPAQQAKQTPEEKKAKEAAKDAEKLRLKIIKEGGKKGVEIEGASDMGGLDFFCTTMELPDGDLELLELAMLAMNAEPDPGAEDRKGCSGHIGKMIYSAGVEQLAIVAYVPGNEHNKSAEKVDVTKWMDEVCEKVGAVVTKKATVVQSLVPNKNTGDLFGGTTGTVSGKIVVAVAKSNPEAGKFALKDKDLAMAAAFAYLRTVGAFPEDEGDDSDDMVFGDDSNFDDYS